MTKFERLAKALTEAIGVPVFESGLHGAQGYYRQVKADCRPWTGMTGDFAAGDVGHSISCWDTATDCLKFGFSITIDRGSGSYGYYNVWALDPAKVDDLSPDGMVWIPPRKRKPKETAL